MVKKSSVVFSLLTACAFLVGCAGPEQKLGRGVSNSVEPFRLGELRRSIEQTAIFGSPDQSRTVGIIHGFDRTIARTGVGLYEIVTFPIPNHPMGDYSAVFHPADPVFPDSYKPNWGVTSTLQPNASLDFSGGDIAPLIPGSRFRIFDN
ncbi:MAG: exosortase system-associated protein, TIGR04073 family [Limisphaerales bacterium]